MLVAAFGAAVDRLRFGHLFGPFALGTIIEAGELPVEVEIHGAGRSVAMLAHDDLGDALEAIALEGYRSGALTRGQAGRLLGFDFWEEEAFLKERHAVLPYDQADLEADRADLARAESE